MKSQLWCPCDILLNQSILSLLTVFSGLETMFDNAYFSENSDCVFLSPLILC